MFSYKIKKDSDLRLKAGLGARTGSFAAQFLIGASYKGFHGGFAYDIPVNGVQDAPGVQNFFELAVAVAISLFGLHSGAALATVVGVLIEVPIMLSLVEISKRWKY